MFGEQLRGSVRVNATLLSPGKENVLIYDEKNTLVRLIGRFEMKG